MWCLINQQHKQEASVKALLGWSWSEVSVSAAETDGTQEPARFLPAAQTSGYFLLQIQHPLNSG